MKRVTFGATAITMFLLAGTCSAALVARYTLDGSVNDIAGNQHGTVVGSVTYEPGVFGQALQLDGAGAYVNCGHDAAFNITAAITVSAWVKIDTVRADWMTVIAKGNSAWRLSTLQSERKFHFAVTGGPGWHSADGVTAVPAGEWHHVCGTYNGSAIRLYVDGLLDATKAYSGGITANAYDVCIGENLEAWGRYWDGAIDNVRVYNHAVGDAAVLELFGKGVRPAYNHPGLAVCAAPSGPQWVTYSSRFVDLEDASYPPVRSPAVSMGSGLITDRDSDLAITFNGELYSSGNERVFIRALVDGEPASPSDVVAATGGFTGTRSFTFAKKGVGPGGHWVQMQWLVDSGGAASIGDTTLTLCASSPLIEHGSVITVAAPSGPAVSTSAIWWSDIPNLSGSLVTTLPGNLAATISAETWTSAGKRLFVRALVDGQPASPSDVVFAAGDFSGTRAFTFIKDNVPPGNHSIQLQWSVDGSGTGYMGDRTLALRAAAELTPDGGLSVKAAASGPSKEFTAYWWADIPDMGCDIATAAGAKLEITFGGEVFTSAGKRMFVRALVDGQPASPSDVVLTAESFTGVRSFTFTKEDLTAGPHEVRMQWLIDAGGTASVGDRTLVVNHWRSQVPDLSKSFDTLKPTIGKRNLLVILWDPSRPDHPAPAKSAIEDLIFGPRQSVRDYFLESSGGRFSLERAGVIGWVYADKDAEHYWNHPSSCCPEGFTGGHVEKWAEAIRKADDSFNYRAYDADGDGVLRVEELAVLMVIPQNSPFGTVRPVAGRECPDWAPLVVDDVRIDSIAEAYIGAPPHAGVAAHELAHLLLGAGDMYFWFFQPYAAGAYSLMDQSPSLPQHLDPFHKLRLGWLMPRIVEETGWQNIDDVETNGEVYTLNDPLRGNKEYFVLENRWRGDSYDSGRPDVGLGVWHVIEDPAVYGSLPAPLGAPVAEWNKVAAHDWARRAIRMIRPVYGPPFNDWVALWDGSDPATGYDLLAVDPNPNHVTLRWIDGAPGNFAVRRISPAGSRMNVLIESH